MRTNRYYPHLNVFFERLISLRYNAYRINGIVVNSIKNYEDLDEDRMVSFSSLAISDITGLTDNGWTINFSTGASRATFARNYKEEAINLVSIECCYAVAQSFEAIEKLFKDLVYEKSSNDGEFFEGIKSAKFPENIRSKYPGGKKLFTFVRKATKESFRKFSHSNNYKLKFSEFWHLLSEVRHAITHSQGIANKKNIFKSLEYEALYNHFFDFTEEPNDQIRIVIDYKQLNAIIKSIAEFAYQVYKILCISDGFDYRVKLDINKKSP